MKTLAAASPIAAFLAQSPLPHFINGKWQASTDRPPEVVYDPADGTILAQASLGGEREVDQAVRAAHAAFGAWGRTSPRERAVLLHRLADRMEKEKATLAQLESLDVGKAISLAEGFDIPFGIECVRYFADLATHAHYSIPLAIKNIEARVHRTPYGACGFIFPWNFPFDLLMWGIAPALAAGNTVVVKPSEVTPLSTLYVARLAAEAGFPAGVINIVLGKGDVGAALCKHPLVRRMSFTGSPEVGKLVGAACGARPIPCKLELGGKGAAVVFEDADVPATAKALAGAITMNTGQVCCTATRWVIHESIYDQFVSEVTAALRGTKIGPGADPATEMGPVVSAVQRDRVLDYLKKGKAEGAEVLLESEAPRIAGHEGGFYVSPWLLTGDEKNVCFREEVFGPAAFITKFRDEEAVIEQVNVLEYGLANSVWSTDLKRANRVAERMVAGNSWVNAHNVFAYGLPYGGVNLSGMGGGVNSPETFYDYLRPLTVARPL